MSAPQRFRKKPVEVEAIQYLPHDNCEQVGAFMGFDVDGEGCDETGNDEYAVETLHGLVWASPGDWIVRGPSGDYWPVKPDIFKQTYEPAGGV